MALPVHLQGYKVLVHTRAVTGQEWPMVAASLRGKRENLGFHPLESSTCGPPIVRGLPSRFHALPNNSEEKLGDLQEHGLSPKPATLAWLCIPEQMTTHCEPQISFL